MVLKAVPGNVYMAHLPYRRLQKGRKLDIGLHRSNQVASQGMSHRQDDQRDTAQGNGLYCPCK